MFLMLFAIMVAAPSGAPAQSSAPPAAPKTPETDVQALFSRLEGGWNCAGAFASGKPLEADLAFERGLGGRTLRYTHRDRLPSVYLQDGSWGVDKESGRLVSLAFTGLGPEPSPTAALYAAETVSPTSVVFVHQRLLKEPWAPNRFTYALEGETLRMTWEVQRQEIWKMGDYLVCRRKTPPSGTKGSRS